MDLRDLVRRALDEDAAGEDLTTRATVPDGTRGRAHLVALDACVIAGTDAFRACFEEMDPGLKVAIVAADGLLVDEGAIVAIVEGALRPILAAERTALNFIQHLSGIATFTRAFVRAAAGVPVYDTRKTSPGLRALEKAAVRAGGGASHRASLAEAILVKDNHIAAAAGIEQAVKAAQSAHPDLAIEVECETLEHVREALAAGAGVLLLDNMDPVLLREAVEIVDGRAITEASGGVTLETIAEVAATGVDRISIGALTHSAPAMDMSFEVEVA